ncbi:MAG: stage 0 sporulation family protein [Clostridia bacterium]|nr:stage 0 sporulation family protein [Clostridia bacterium]
MVKVTAVNFKEGGKVYYFAPGKEEYKRGTGVIVETSAGKEYATVVVPECEIDDSKIVSPLKPVLRIATQKDKETLKKNAERKPEAMRITQEKIAKYKLDMKLIDCEFAFDGSKVIFFYSAPTRVDFRELVKELSSTFKMRIELRQIGIRDEIKMIGGIGPCGRECCCATCMSDFNKVTIKMAKNQGLSLNPGKISGLCGRLMCCLEYENDYYAEAGKQVPKLGSEVGTPDGRGTVVNVNMLKMQARVKIEDKKNDMFTYHDYPVEQLKFKRGNKNQKEEKDEPSDAELKDLQD